MTKGDKHIKNNCRKRDFASCPECQHPDLFRLHNSQAGVQLPNTLKFTEIKRPIINDDPRFNDGDDVLVLHSNGIIDLFTIEIQSEMIFMNSSGGDDYSGEDMNEAVGSSGNVYLITNTSNIKRDIRCMETEIEKTRQLLSRKIKELEKLRERDIN